MTVLTILSPEEIQLFEHPPQFTAEERKRFFTVPKWAEEIIATLHTPTSQVGFLLLLGYFRATKKFYAPDTFAHADIVFAQRRLSLETTGTLEAYAKTTMHRHKILIRAKLGYRHYAPAAHAALAKEADFLLSKHMRLKEIFGVLLAKLEQQKVEVPSYHRLADLITAGFRTYEKRLLSAVENSLRREDKTFLDGLLQTDPAYRERGKQALKIKRYAVTLLKRPNQSTKPAKIQANIQDLKVLGELFEKLQKPLAALSLSPDMIWHYATIVIKTQIFQIARRDEKRYLYQLSAEDHGCQPVGECRN